METVSLKFESEFLHDIENVMKRHRYITKTEFIREAVRDKIKELEKEDLFIAELKKFKGATKNKVSDKRLHDLREGISKEYAKKFGIKLD